MRAQDVVGRAWVRALALTALVVGVAVASAGPASASGSMTVIDSFTSGGGSWQTCGNSYFVYQQDASILGGARELALRDAGSCHYGPYPAQMAIDATAGTASWGGPSTYAPEQHFSYGTEIGTQANVSWSPNPNGGKGTPLHLSLGLSDQIVIQMDQVNGSSMSIRLRDGQDQTYSTSITLVAGTNLVPLAAFAGLTAAAASDIDGISFNGSNKNPVDVASEFAIKGADSDPPVASPTASPAANANGWNSTDVTVSWNWTDAGSGVDAANCTQSSTSAGEGAVTLTSTCADLAGNRASDSVTVNVDKTGPVAAPVVPSGWSNSDVTVNWNWSDAGSGVDPANCTQSSTTAGEGAIALTATCSDLAGNTSSDTVTVDIDKTAPTLSPSVSPNPLALGSTATTSANAADSGSGVASASCGNVDTSSLGTFTVTCTATDNAGNSASATATYEVSGQATKQAILAGMKAAFSQANLPDKVGLGVAILAVNGSLTSRLWTDENHPASKLVFDGEQAAAVALSAVLLDRHSSLADGEVQGWIDGLVGEDQALASLAIADAAAAGSSSQTLTAARKELALGGVEASRGHAAAAIGHYGLAWSVVHQHGRTDGDSDGHSGTLH